MESVLSSTVPILSSSIDLGSSSESLVDSRCILYSTGFVPVNPSAILISMGFNLAIVVGEACGLPPLLHPALPLLNLSLPLCIQIMRLVPFDDSSTHSFGSDSTLFL